MIGVDIVDNCFIELEDGDFGENVTPKFVISEFVVGGVRADGGLEVETELDQRLFGNISHDLINDGLWKGS